MKRILIWTLVIFVVVFTFASCRSDTPSTAPDSSTTKSGNETFVDTHVHSYGEWKIVNEPTATEEGLKERVCGCGNKESETIAFLNLGSQGLEFALDSVSKSYTVTGLGTCTDTHIEIPSYYNGLPVTRIGDYAFEGCGYIVSITIPNSMKKIGTLAFLGCDSLIEVCNKSNLDIKIGMEIPGRVAYFAKHVIADESETALKYIGDYIFFDDGFEVYLAKYIGKETEITLPEYEGGKKYGIWRCAFNDKITNITMEDFVIDICDFAFFNCKSLVDITIPASVTSIDYYVFSGCSSLTSITIPKSVTTIDYHAFNDCESMTNVYFGGNLEDWLNMSIKSNPCKSGANLYFDGELVTNITIPDSVTSIGDSAFCGCTSLVSVTIPKSIKSIGNLSFYNCKSLEDVYYLGNVEDWLNISLKSSPCDSGANLYFNGELVTSVTIPNNVNNIGDYAFYNCTSLTSVTMGNSVESIGSYAFYNCTSLTSVMMGDSVESIGSYAFFHCYLITSITIPDSVTTIDFNAFSYCTLLTDINFEGTVAEWNSKNKGANWDYKTSKYTVYCTDGQIAKDGTITYN